MYKGNERDSHYELGERNSVYERHHQDEKKRRENEFREIERERERERERKLSRPQLLINPSKNNDCKQ